MPAAYRWDPAQYDRYADERGRPFRELVGRIQTASPHEVVDLGCGPGSLTSTLADRWPGAHVTGVDSSPQMIGSAGAHAVAGRVDFQLADITTWRPQRPVDVVVSNAALQWIPGHLGLVADLAGSVAPGGAFAFQVPDNFTNPSHVIIRELSAEPAWRARLGERADRTLAVERPETYLTALGDAGLEPDVWRTTYLHVLPGEDAVFEWVKGTALRPILDALSGDQAATAEFEAECRERLRAAYPAGPHGTVFPFPRIFAVGHRAQVT
jgi:trans-aconitate 2-methyltransferase